MELREKFEKETGDSVMAYRQDYSGQTPYEDGFSDEYVEWLESKIKNSSSCVAVGQSEQLKAKERLLEISMQGYDEWDVTEIVMLIQRL